MDMPMLYKEGHFGKEINKKHEQNTSVSMRVQYYSMVKRTRYNVNLNKINLFLKSHIDDCNPRSETSRIQSAITPKPILQVTSHLAYFVSSFNFPFSPNRSQSHVYTPYIRFHSPSPFLACFPLHFTRPLSLSDTCPYTQTVVTHMRTHTRRGTSRLR